VKVNGDQFWLESILRRSCTHAMMGALDGHCLDAADFDVGQFLYID